MRTLLAGAKSALCVLAGFALLMLLPSSASAQSTIQGIVKDSSGAVMANVTVEASSPALIEKTRTVTTDGSGRYEIVDLRPGTYSVTFTAAGFKTVKRDGVDVPANVSVPLYVDMAVGAVGETVEVQAVASIVDVENATTKQLLTREIQDSIPAPRNMQALGGLVPGIQLHSASGGNPDVGGSQQMEQTYITGHGNGAVHTTVLLDGMNINSNYIDGTIQNYVDNAIIQQATYQTSGITAEVSAGGALVNQIPKDGGNTFHADVFLSGTGNGGWWQANNIDNGLRARGATSGNSIVHIEDFDGSVGGPIIRDRLWFLASGRYQSTYDIAANVFYPKADGSGPDLTKPGIEDQYIKQGVLRLSWQISSKDKFSGTYDRIQKFKGHELTPLAFTPVDPATAASRRGPPLYYVAQGKWTRIQTSRLLFEAGFSTDIIHYSDIYQVGQEEQPFTPGWFSHISKQDLGFAMRSNAPPRQAYFLPDRRNVSGQASYVTGSHSIKVGVQDAWGKNDQVSSMNGDLYANFLETTPGAAPFTQPFSVTVYNTPIAARRRVDSDLGIYAMDTWHVKRFALTYGVRFEYEKSSIEPQSITGGRFVGPRSFGRIDCSTIKGLGCWKTWSPRLGIVYDLFGNGKTAVRASFGKYNTPQATGYIDPFNPMGIQTDTRSWNDLDHDGIPQDSEIGPSFNPGFGLPSGTPKLDPNFKREYNLQYSAGLTHQVRPNMSVSFNWFRRTNYDATFIQNRAIDPVTDWTPFTLINPLDGSTITAYSENLDATKRTPDLFQTNADQDKTRNTYTGFEFGAVTRLPRSGHIFAGWTIEHNTFIDCQMNAQNLFDGSNFMSGSINDPNSLRFCDERGLLPFRSDVKIVGNQPTWKGFELSMAYQSAPEFLKYTNWNINKNTTYPVDGVGVTPGAKVAPNLNQPSLVIPLIPPGSKYHDRLNQLDLGVKRNFVIKERLRLQAQLDVFNVANAHTVLVETQTLGARLSPAPGATGPDYRLHGDGGTPTQILQARLLRLAVQVHF